jgi:hypothetical protein
MATIRLPQDFKDFVRLLNDPKARYLLIGGYIEITTTISGVSFEECYEKRVIGRIDDIEIPLIDLESLIKNKKANGRPKDINDIDNLVAH